LRYIPAGVGITGELPGSEEGQDAASSQGPSDQLGIWQGPTERLAMALGLQVSQLAHMTGRIPGDPDGALHRLRYNMLMWFTWVLEMTGTALK
jgi:hypothetical protein